MQSPCPSTVRWSLSARRAWIEISIHKSSILHDVSLSARRAWIEIFDTLSGTLRSSKSLSARRAWIEICCGTAVIAFLSGSLSARRAWIEMPGPRPHRAGNSVALRKESVDRNFDDRVALIPHQRRSPQGERG